MFCTLTKSDDLHINVVQYQSHFSPLPALIVEERACMSTPVFWTFSSLGNCILSTNTSPAIMIRYSVLFHCPELSCSIAVHCLTAATFHLGDACISVFNEMILTTGPSISCIVTFKLQSVTGKIR